mgnify:CR=1 FL=1
MEIQYRHEKANAHWQRPILAPAGGKAQFILQDAQGKELLNNALLFIDEKEYLKLPNLANGLYTYKIIYTDETFTGKLNILI